MQNHSEDLMLQVRTAHRLLVAYYQRLLPEIKRLATDLNVSFESWAPIHHSFPRCLNDPSEWWTWDLVPAMNARFLMSNIPKENKTRRGDYIVELMVLHDEGYIAAHGRSEPDALDIPTSVEDVESKLKVRTFMATQDADCAIYHACSILSDRYGNDIPVSPGVPPCGFIVSCYEISLTELLKKEGHDEVSEELRRRLDSLKKEVETTV